MAFLKLVLLAFVFVTSEAEERRSNITRGSSLTPAGNSSWLSNSGLYAFGFYREGNGCSVGIFLAGIPEKTVVWTANRDRPVVTSNASLLFTGEGKLVLQSTQDQYYIGDSLQPASSASMLDSGNFVLYDSRGSTIWQSFDNPTDTLLPTQRLSAGKELISSISEYDHSAGIFRLKMQEDGNLCQYPVGTPDTAGHSYYSSFTDGTGGNNGSWEIEEASSSNKCDPKGLCGLNGFCVQIDQETNCLCLPGFDFVKKGNSTAGCERNFIADSCGNKNMNFTYTIEEVGNTNWEDNPYSEKSVAGKEECKQACFDDCNCEAAFYKDQRCKMQRPPLRYGRRQLSDSNVALIKVYASTSPRVTTNLRASNSKVRMDILIVSVLLVAFGSIMSMISVVVLYKSKFWAYKRIRRNSDDVEMSEEVGPRLYTFEELEIMTDGFKEEIGRGSFGTVYKGTVLSSQKLVAVKRLEKVLEEGEREFQNEMRAIGRTNHRNLVHLLGYCHEGPKRLLVYEYMSNGSLANMLFATEARPCWDERLGIACGIARGILYLHEECETQIIHCDIKPENILMDENRRAKISDFGLAKLLKPDQTRTFTGIRGTRGYVAPEWHRRLPITVKADVYSFGIVLLEIICCRKNVMWDLPEEEAILEEWAFDCFESGELLKLAGSEEIEKKQLNRIVKVALWCIQDEPSLRPSMKKVLLMLEGTVDIPIPPSPNSIISKI
ncbi:hypothetical protein UlMin_037926 [Ulmus minor]